jgi:hypothetical protein
MIHPLRDLHLRIFSVLAVVLPLLLLCAIAWRDPLRPHTPPASSVELVKTYPKLLPRYGIDVEVRRSDGNLLLILRGDIREPDVLVYLNDPNQNPLSARLIGGFRSGSPIALPPAAYGAIKLTLYSGARHEVLDKALLETGR